MGVKWGATLLFAPFGAQYSALNWTFEPTGGLEPPTARLQVGCAASCATPAGHGTTSRYEDRDLAGADSAAGRPSGRCERGRPVPEPDEGRPEAASRPRVGGALGPAGRGC